MMKKTLFTLLLLLVSSCSTLQQLSKRLVVFALEFEKGPISASLTLPDLSDATATLSSLLEGKSFSRALLPLDKVGITVHASFNVHNPNAVEAVMDSSIVSLYIDNLAQGARTIDAQLAPFSVKPGQNTTVQTSFPVTLDSPVFSPAIWRKVLRQEDIGYKFTGTVFYNLVDFTQTTLPKSLTEHQTEFTIYADSLRVSAPVKDVQTVLALLSALAK